ncbi:TonB-dependent receptor [Chitinophaga pendula]|uniref:TonB-dependent receptor n=1 Tax=Chitinophaga TaxID=79328 RepID=UPI000BB0BFA1|nr:MULTISPECIES: TonB-dependent receptor [Chitinophaga]ASZ12607.1 TonB-dependent receptor [Chitinophaga sp. MD30]UCJ09789.1 TonB-dependent receptor [Chitinophaga pendula]
MLPTSFLNRLAFGVGCLCLLLDHVAVAQQRPEGSLDSIPVKMKNAHTALEEVVVTAGRSRQRLKDVPQKIELISNKDIAATPALDVTDIVKKTTSVNVIQYPGILSGVGIRGFRPQFSGINQRTLLLINGRPAGTTNLGTIDLNNIDHIEVLKGPASALYGSQAMGGVINIIPLQSSGQISGNLFADYGSFSTFQFGGRAGGNITRRLDFDISGTYFDRDANFNIGKGNLFRDWLGSKDARNIYANGKDTLVNDARGDGQKRPNTRYAYYSTAARIGYQLDSVWRVDISGSLFNAKDVESPGDIFSGEAGAGLKNILRYNSEAALTGRIRNNELSARLYYAKEQSKTFAIRNARGIVIDTPYQSGLNTYQWYGIQLRDIIHLRKQRLIVGYDYNRTVSQTLSYAAPVNATQKESTTAPNAALITNGWYVQGQFTWLSDRLKVNPGIRLDVTRFAVESTPAFSQTLITGAKTNLFVSPSISAQYDILPSLTMHGSIGRAFVTPDAYNVAGYQVSGKGTGKVVIARGNPSLKNESSLSGDLGLRYEHVRSGIAADITFFNTRVTDRIVSRSAPPATPETLDGDVVTAVTNYFNANRSTISGLEIMASYDLGALVNYRYSLRFFTNITRTFKADDITVATNGTTTKAAIQNVATANINYGVEYSRGGKYGVRLTGRYVGKRWDTDFNDPLRPLVQYPAFMTMDAAINYAVTRRHQISVAVANITDENYYEKRGYNMPGRNYRIRYTYQFGKNIHH